MKNSIIINTKNIIVINCLGKINKIIISKKNKNNRKNIKM